MRCHWNRKGCELSTPASQPRQKLAVIKENAKYSFVELGKLNTSLYTRRILKRFRRLHRQCPHSLVLLQFEPFSVASALILLFPPPRPPQLADSDFIQSQKRALAL